MNSKSPVTRYATPVGVLVALLIAAISLQASAEHAAKADPAQGPQMGTGHHGGHHGKHHGAYGGHHGHHTIKTLHATHWRSTLTPEQQAALDSLKVALVRNTASMKLRMQALKAELAELTVADNFDLQQVEAKIDAYLLLKREKMLLTYKYKSGVRANLNPEQRLTYDMELLRTSKHGRHGGK